jgi:hypothetical protein
MEKRYQEEGNLPGDEDSIAVRDCDENWKQGNEQQKLYYCRDDADHG